MKTFLIFALVFVVGTVSILGRLYHYTKENFSKGLTGQVLTITENSTVIDKQNYNEVIITFDIGDGDVTLSNMRIGLLTVNGGGKNSIKIESCEIGRIISEKIDDSGVRFVISGTTKIDVIEVLNYTIIQAEAADKVSEFIEVIVKSEMGLPVKLELIGVKIGKLIMETDVEVMKKGKTTIREIIERSEQEDLI
jgi:hypothetical protein